MRTIATIATILVSTTTYAGQIRVPIDYPTIQAAINAAADEDMVRVYAGTYRENVTITKPLSLVGDGADVTTIEAAVEKTVVSIINAGTVHVQGFTIRGGRAVGPDDDRTRYGGAIYCDDTTLYVEDNVLVNNQAFYGGGAIHVARANDGKISGNIVTENVTGSGGAITFSSGTIEIASNVVSRNTGTGNHGAGIFASGQNLRIHDNVVEYNSVVPSTQSEYTQGWGAGVLIFDPGTTATLYNNVVRYNYAAAAGSGEFFDDGATVHVSNELIYGNLCPQDGGAGIYVDGADWGADLQAGSNVTLDRVTIADHPCGLEFGDGLYVEYLSKVTVTNSIFQGNGKDFYVETSHDPATLEISNSRSTTPWPGVIHDVCNFADVESGDYSVTNQCSGLGANLEAKPSLTDAGIVIPDAGISGVPTSTDAGVPTPADAGVPLNSADSGIHKSHPKPSGCSTTGMVGNLSFFVLLAIATLVFIGPRWFFVFIAGTILLVAADAKALVSKSDTVPLPASITAVCVSSSVGTYQVGNGPVELVSGKYYVAIHGTAGSNSVGFLHGGSVDEVKKSKVYFMPVVGARDLRTSSRQLAIAETSGRKGGGMGLYLRGNRMLLFIRTRDHGRMATLKRQLTCKVTY